MKSSMVVVFGKPGAGKTTISNAAVQKIGDHCGSKICLLLDLDVVIPDWMKDNFAKGVYPTLNERTEFAASACDYVDREVLKTKNHNRDSDAALFIIISFSFVNTDLRDHFRSRFPQAKWALVDVSDSTAQDRIDKREDHFYKGTPKEEGPKTEKELFEENQDTAKDEKAVSSEWQFAPVDFDHIVLDGLLSIEGNADNLVEVLILEFSSDRILKYCVSDHSNKHLERDRQLTLHSHLLYLGCRMQQTSSIGTIDVFIETIESGIEMYEEEENYTIHSLENCDKLLDLPSKTMVKNTKGSKTFMKKASKDNSGASNTASFIANAWNAI